MGAKAFFSGALKTILPTIGAALALPPPFGQMAAAAVGKALGVETLTPEHAQDAITQAQLKDPDALLKLKAADQQFALDMERLGIEKADKVAQHFEDLLRIDADDRASARAREMAVKDKIPAILAIGVTAGFFTLLGLFAFREIPVASQTILNVLVGSLGTAWIGIINYYFGSSSGSAAKTAILAEQAASNTEG